MSITNHLIINLLVCMIMAWKFSLFIFVVFQTRFTIVNAHNVNKQQNVYHFKLQCHKTWFISLCCSILTLNSCKLCAYITNRFLTVKKRSILFNLIIRRRQNQCEHNTTDVDFLSMDVRDVSKENYRRLLIVVHLWLSDRC